MKPEKRKKGRPSSYTPELAEEILARLCDGESLKSITNDSHTPHFSTVYKWLFDDVDGFADRYARARQIQAANIADQAIQVSREAFEVASGAPGTGEAGARVQAKKVLADNLKWMAGKLDSPKWGHKTTSEISGPDGGAIKTESKTLELTPELQAELDKINLVNQSMVRPEGIEE